MDSESECREGVYIEEVENMKRAYGLLLLKLVRRLEEWLEG